jgi:hypothetical protein
VSEIWVEVTCFDSDQLKYEKIAPKRKRATEEAMNIETRQKFEEWAATHDMDLKPSRCTMGAFQYSDCDADFAWEAWKTQAATIDTLQAEVVALKQDAARYRWLRTEQRIGDGWTMGVVLTEREGIGKNEKWKLRALSGEELDARIDAIQQQNLNRP